MALKLTLTEGFEYVLTAPDGLGDGVGAIPTGTVVRIEELNTQSRAGAGGDLVISFAEPTVVVDGEEIEPRRRVALSVREFKSMFVPAGDN